MAPASYGDDCGRPVEPAGSRSRQVSQDTLHEQLHAVPGDDDEHHHHEQPDDQSMQALFPILAGIHCLFLLFVSVSLRLIHPDGRVVHRGFSVRIQDGVPGYPDLGFRGDRVRGFVRHLPVRLRCAGFRSSLSGNPGKRGIRSVTILLPGRGIRVLPLRSPRDHQPLPAHRSSSPGPALFPGSLLPRVTNRRVCISQAI